ncbi:MAG TPA: amidohydrolase family protein, partial [Chthoniobacteraceae bacterium]
TSLCAYPAAAQRGGAPIIDMHLHALTVDFLKDVPACTGAQKPLQPTVDPRAPFDPNALGKCPKPLLSSASDEALMRDSLAMLKKLNIRRAVTAGALSEVTKWRAAAPSVIIPAQNFATAKKPFTLAELRRLHGTGAFSIFAEVGPQYEGISAGDARWEPFYALAEELDIPVGVHLGEGPPAAARFPGYETYRASLTTPFQLEEVLWRHPKLRIYVMHYASPLVDEMIAMMFTHPNLYVDIAGNNWISPPIQFHDHLKRMVDAGFGERIMFGSDQMIWPGAIAEAVKSVDEAPFLTAAQKRDILYNNAARFLRLTERQIAADHTD